MKMSANTDFSSDSDSNGSDAELQGAFSSGALKPGLNTVKVCKQYVNNISGLKQKVKDFKLDLPWIELLDFVNKPAPLAPELASQVLEQEQKRENQLKNNKKLVQFPASEDPVLNDFKREMLFHRQAQATVLEAIPKLKALNIPTKRPDDYFAEMAKTDEHMQKVREKLMQKHAQQQRSEKVKQLRTQRKEGKALQIQTKLQRQQEKKDVLDRLKKVRKGKSNDLDFLNKPSKNVQNRKPFNALQKRKKKNEKFGFGGKKKGSKLNTKDSSADVSDYKRPRKPTQKGKVANKRPGKNRRLRNKGRGKK